MQKLVYFFSFQGHTVFMPLKFLYPECLYLIEEHSKVEPLQCFRMPCPANQNCAEILARKVDYLFTEVMPFATQMFVYFNYRNDKFYRRGEHVTSLGAGLFYKDLREPEWIKLNRWGFNKCKKEGDTYQWLPTTEFLLMGGSPDLIPVENLIHHP